MTSLPGAERFQRPPQEQPRKRSRDPVVQANRIPIIRVLSDLWNVHVPEGMGHRSWKTFCPLGWEHPDGGIDKGFRVYEQSNTAYCFVMHGSLTPVRLAQMKWGGKQFRVAYRLMEQYGVGKRHWKDRYEDVLRELDARADGSRNGAVYVEALQLGLSNIANYTRLQFEPEIVRALERELTDLDELVAGHPTDDQIRGWYRKAIDKMNAVVVEVNGSALS